jgi:DNA modification methylase
MRLHCGDCLPFVAGLPAESVDMVLTSPPYGDMRSYDGAPPFTHAHFQALATELFRVVKAGGVVVWVCGDKTKRGDKSGDSFRQALHFKDVGFALSDTMIFAKKNPFPTDTTYRYYAAHEFMFVLVKGPRPATFNALTEPSAQRLNRRRDRRGDTTVTAGAPRRGPPERVRHNIWHYSTTGRNMTADDVAHPAMFPEQLAVDHVLSWSREGDVVLDPFAGVGTTGKAALLHNRDFVGCDVNPGYIAQCERRLSPGELDRYRAELAA